MPKMPPAIMRIVTALLASAAISLYPFASTAAERFQRDRSIKGVDPKNLPFNAVIKVEAGYTDKILYDRAVEGDMCFITCNNYSGVVSKWSNYHVDLQPFENFCMFLTGCSSQYPIPSREVILKVGEEAWTLRMVEPEQSRYYLPLEARQAIGERRGKISLEISGIKMPVYRIGPKNLPLLADVVNQTVEKQGFVEPGLSAKSKEGRLAELQSLRDKNLITPAEYAEARRRIIQDD